MKKILYLKYCLILLLFFQVLSSAQDKTKKIDEYAQKFYEYGLLNGTVLAAENGNVVFAKGFGMANAEKNIPNAADTKFRLASVTKQFTSMLIMQLVEQGKIKLDGKLGDYLPYYRRDVGDKVTIHQLLNHTSGIPSYTDQPGFMMSGDVNKPTTVTDFVINYASGELAYEPGTEYRYNNSAYYILGAIIEQITGKTYAQVLKENILDPLGMSNTGVEYTGMNIENYSSGYNMTAMGLQPAMPIEMSNVGAAGAMYSTVEDMLKWDRALYSNKLISEESKKLMFTPYLNNYGYGWVVTDGNLGDRKVKLTLHTGGIFGYSTIIMRMIDDDKTIIVLNNISNGNASQLANGIALILYGLEPEQPAKPLLGVFLNTLNEKGIDEAIKEFNELSKDEKNYEYNESDLNNAGYLLLQRQKTDDAIKVFELNTELFPESYNVWDSLGEAWMIKGDKEKAIKYYRKSLELNPDSPTGKDALKKLEGM
jgi:CubicO group peptidase (beta-lactamase class C family)